LQGSDDVSFILRCDSSEIASRVIQIIESKSPSELQTARLHPSNSKSEHLASWATPGSAKDNTFDLKTDKNSSELYFNYYGMLMHQQNMLQVCHNLIHIGGLRANNKNFQSLSKLILSAEKNG
jgi:hypothetical protein